MFLNGLDHVGWSFGTVEEGRNGFGEIGHGSVGRKVNTRKSRRNQEKIGKKSGKRSRFESIRVFFFSSFLSFLLHCFVLILFDSLRFFLILSYSF